MGRTWKRRIEVGGGSSREADEGEAEVRGWLKATGRARGVQEVDARGKCLGHRLEFRLERREQGTE